MFDSIINQLLLRKFRTKIVGKKFVETLESEFAEEFLELLLKLMGLMFCVDKDFRRNIENFDAKYLFKDKSEDISVGVVFKNSKMKVIEGEMDHTNVTIIFKSQKALMNFLLSPKLDILSTILNQDVTYEGNLNYISKFVYMANHLRLMFTGS